MTLVSISAWLRRPVLLVLSGALAAALVLSYFATRTPPIPRRTLRIGFENVPPVQFRTASGPAGLAVETVKEAAKRAGISLHWVETGTSSDEAFQRGLVDLWPIMADLPERRKRIHITRPWLHASHVLVLRPGSAIPGRDFAGGIALFRMPLHLRLARQEFPEAHLLQFPDNQDVVKQVCTGAVAAAFLEDRAALTALRDKPAECASIALRVETLPDLTVQLGVGSTFEAAGAADKIRDEIGGLFRDGTLAATIARYSYYGLDDAWATYNLMDAAERARWLAWGLIALSIGVGLTVWQAASLRQRRRSAAAVQASEERFRAIFHQAAVGVAQVNLDGEVTMVNGRCCEVLACTPDELVGTTWESRMHPDDFAAVLKGRRRLMAAEISSFSLETRFVRKGGDIAWAKFYESLVRDAGGLPKYLVAVLEDVTERKRAEEALQESENRFRNMADSAPAMIWVSGPDKLCTFFSRGWLSFTGSTMDQALGNAWSEMVHPEDREACYTRYSSSFDARRGFQTECRLRRADGEYRWVLTTGAPRFDSSGTFAGFIGFCSDITDVKHAQEEAIARQKLEGLGVLAGGIAHDFNNLLGAILANSELALSDLPAGSSAYGEVESIKQVADRAAEIVRQMMAYAGQENPAFEPLDLSGLVKEMLQLLTISISKHARLVVDLPENLPAVQANATQIRQVVMNLITNASESLGEKEGVISIALARANTLSDSTNNRPQNDYVRLRVTDTGQGMTKENQARIFDPFFTTKFAGRGLGLSAVQGIIRDHGGVINVVSALGQGSSFEVLLPSASEPARDAASAVASPSVDETERVEGMVLVVEDEDGLRDVVSKMLRKRGFSVVAASDGDEGVNLFRANQQEIDLVLLDLTLPGMTCREVCEEIRRMRPEVAVIITSAYSQDIARKALGGRQPFLFIRKPYGFGELTELLRDASRHTRSAGQAAR
jgi:two-component system, cell cycle sensor histidine kinase and response regulator CckA